MRIWIFQLVAICILGASCRSGPGQTGSGKDPIGTLGRTPSVSEIRTVLSKIQYSPQGKGYTFMATAPGPDLDDWIQKHRAYLDWALEKLPDGFGLQVVGNTCNIGPVAANIPFSTARARQVQAALIRAGYPLPRLGIAGRADAAPTGTGLCAQSSRQVTFEPALGP